METWWESINADDSRLPLIVPLILWSTCFLYCQRKSAPSFHRFDVIHNIFNVGVMVLGTASLYYDDDSVFNERITILFTLSYFTVDLVDCLLRWDVTYMFHAIVCLVFGFYAMTDPIVHATRANSRSGYMELSTPFMHLAKRTKHKFHSALFFLVFTCCRIVYIPFIIRALLYNGKRWTDVVLWLYCALYTLQLWWWYKMWRIMIKAFVKGKDTKDDIKTE